ncbi:MAG: hypothetical protein CME62_06620 [Halobacteriovoraceae bacterium]|nr:hypothetical protein [Halobacteriovoraceae bacterium]|tara:strand:- start:35989 stop:36258 length:270 start_codon:yes stop_codon:yes gene_type:complete
MVKVYVSITLFIFTLTSFAGDVCIVKAGKRSTVASVSIHCANTPAETVFSKKDVGNRVDLTREKAKAMKRLFLRGYKMESADTFVKYDR